MSLMSIEMLTKERVTELWPVLEPHFDAACEGNEIAKDEIAAKDIYVLTQTDMAVVFVGFEDDTPACVMALQFNDTNGKRGADVIALAGRGLMRFKAAYWRSILEWLKANGVEFIDAYAPDRLAKIYMSKFGFDKSCSYVRMTL
jgi:hypothetical protein